MRVNMENSTSPNLAAGKDASNSSLFSRLTHDVVPGCSPLPASSDAILTLKQEIYGPYWVSHVLKVVNGQPDDALDSDDKPDWMTEEE